MRTFSDENCSSKSKRSSLGGSSSLNWGGNTAGVRGGRGVSNWGVIRVRGSCFTFSWSYALEYKIQYWLSFLIHMQVTLIVCNSLYTRMLYSAIHVQCIGKFWRFFFFLKMSFFGLSIFQFSIVYIWGTSMNKDQCASFPLYNYSVNLLRL